MEGRLNRVGFAGAVDGGISACPAAAVRCPRRHDLALQAGGGSGSLPGKPPDDCDRLVRGDPRREPGKREEATDRLLLRLPHRQRRQVGELRPLDRPRGDRDRPVPGLPLLPALPRLRSDVPPADPAGPGINATARRTAHRVRRRASRLEGVPAPLQQGTGRCPDRALAGRGDARGAGPPEDRPVPRRRRKLVSAILLGGNVTVKQGTGVGGVFRHVRACGSPRRSRA